MDAANLAVAGLRREIAKRLADHYGSGASLSLRDLAEAVLPLVTKPATYTDDDVRAAIMFEAYAAEHTGTVQESDPKPEEAGT